MFLDGNLVHLVHFKLDSVWFINLHICCWSFVSLSFKKFLLSVTEVSTLLFHLIAITNIFPGNRIRIQYVSRHIIRPFCHYDQFNIQQHDLSQAHDRYFFSVTRDGTAVQKLSGSWMPEQFNCSPIWRRSQELSKRRNNGKYETKESALLPYKIPSSSQERLLVLCDRRSHEPANVSAWLPTCVWGTTEERELKHRRDDNHCLIVNRGDKRLNRCKVTLPQPYSYSATVTVLKHYGRRPPTMNNAMHFDPAQSVMTSNDKRIIYTVLSALRRRSVEHPHSFEVRDRR